MLSISFLGKSKIKYNGNSVHENLGGKAIALLCLFVLREDSYLSRKKIESLLWPDSNIEAAKYNLRYNLWLIKKNIGDNEHGNSFLQIDNKFCRINRDYDFKCDIKSIMKFKPGRDDTIESLLKLKRLLRGDLLEGYFFNNCNEFNDIIIYERINFERYKVNILKRLVELYENNQAYDSAVHIIKEILEIEPYDEEIILKLMDLYVKSGKRTKAIEYYKNYNIQLGGNLGITPSNELKDKYKEIKYMPSSSSKEIILSEFRKENNSDIIKKRAKIEIVSNCMNNIDYFWIVDVLNQLIKLDNGNMFTCLNEKDLLDLGYINSNILKYFSKEEDIIYEYKSEVKDVCIINSFIKLLRNICAKENLIIIIQNSVDLDEISINVLEYLNRLEIKGLRIIEK